jgi:hypothetical protein
MADFRVEEFKGIRPGRSALKLPKGEAQTASNAKLGSGDLEPWTDVDAGTAVKNLYYNRTIYKYDNDGSPLWFEWNSYVDVAPSSVKGDTLERIYYTGDGVPKMTYRTIANTGSGPYPATYRRLGIPQPSVAPTVSGSALPETLDSGARRAISGSIKTKKFEVVFANFTVYPGVGTADEQWNPTGSGQMAFDLQPGDSVKVTEVIDDDTVRLGSATGTGAFTVTAANDKSSTDFWTAMANNGNTQTIDATGWRLPDGVEATITGHLLRVGDVLRVTRTDYTQGLLYNTLAATNFFESSWSSPVEVTVDGSTFYQVANGTLLASADGTTDFPALLGGFFYDIDRAASDSDSLEDRSYVYTYVSALGEEGPPSDPSPVVNALNGDVVSITGMQMPTTHFREIPTMRLYRTNATLAGTEYQFVKEFPAATSTTENVKNEDLGEVLATTTWDPPPAALAGITSMPNGMMVGFVGKTLHLCEPYFPHAWPAEYDQAIDYEIVGLAALGNSVAILTEGVPYFLTGSHPRNVNVRPYKINQACVSKQSIASTEDRIVYASPDGLVEISVNGAKLVTADYVGKEEWESYSPTTMVGEIHDGKYFGFFDGPDNVTQPPAGVVLTGTVLTEDDTADETDIVAGGRTIILTLTSETWVAAGATFNAQRQNIINGLTAATDYYTGWNEAVLPNIPVTDVVRTSSTVVTITLSARAEYSITDTETITAVVPGTALTGGDALTAGETFTVSALEDYSSVVIAFTAFDNGGTDLAYAVSSKHDIIDWDSYAGAGLTDLDEFTPADAVHSIKYTGDGELASERWVCVGSNGSGAAQNPNTGKIVTSDDHGVTWTSRAPVYPASTSRKFNAVAWHPQRNVFVAVGDNLTIETSPDGYAWSEASVDPAIASTDDIVEVMTAPEAAKYMYAALSGSNNLLRSPDLSANPASGVWTPLAITYPAATGSKLAASGDGAIVSIGTGATNMEIAYTPHEASSGSSVGTINTYNCVGLAFGADTWVAISDDFRIITCGGGDDADTIGNWSSPSSAKASNVTMSGIKYDQGNGIKQGYGWIAYGVNTSTSKGVIYTSPDAVTWTLRHTHTQSVAVVACATRYPEDQLASTLLSFSPTYNGAQAPTLVGDSLAYYYLDNGSTASAEAETDLTVQKVTGDCIINMVGRESGVGADQGSSSAADTDLFNLNEEPDSVRITITEEALTGNPDGTVDLIYEGFVDSSFFVPVINFKYGVQADARNQQIHVSGEPFDKFSFSTITVQFTFRKAGYNDLSVSYKIRGRAHSATGGAIL